MTLRDLIIEYRQVHDLSQRQFAEKCDISNGYISMLENNYNPKTGKPAVPSLKMMKKLATGMNMSLDELLEKAEGLVVDISKSKNTTPEEAARKKEFIELFECLSIEEQSLVIAQMKGILASR